jgi:HPr kinase/phosphorylase
VTGRPLHASAVAVEGRGVLITGPSGSGKSSLALELIGMGASLVADDGVLLSRGPEGRVIARAPAAIRGLIEARGVGLLRARAADDVPLALVVDLSQVESDRLPPERTTTLLGTELPLLHKVESPHFPAAIRQYLAAGRSSR